MPTKSYVSLDLNNGAQVINTPDPTSAQQAATKHYVDINTACKAAMPAPVTTGTTIQTYTDPLGDIWVAKNGVNSGAWKRARDAIHCRVYRNATLTATTTAANLLCDTVSRDVFGIYTAASGQIVTPVAGIILVTLAVKWTSNANNQTVTALIQLNGTAVASGGVVSAGNATPMSLITTRIYAVPTDNITAFVQGSNNLALVVGSSGVYFEADFIGQG